MKQYQIGTVAKLTGLTVHNLRVWEKRHSAVETQRTPTGRRVYSDQALERLKLLKHCVDNGHTIGAIAAMTDDELRELVSARPVEEPTAGNRAVNVTTVAAEWFDKVQQRLGNEVQWGFIQHYDTCADLRAHHPGSAVDLLLIDQPSIPAAEVKPLGQLIKQINARITLLTYRYARQQDVTYLRTLGVQALKSPLDYADVATYLKRRLKEKSGVVSVLPSRQPPPRLYTDQLLEKAASVSSSIDCECPQHLAEIIQSLTAFEAYSAQCESQDRAGEDLHRHIQLRTGHARAIMEDLLQSVLEQEGIDLSLVKL
ncbi:MerR family transcriptional regulator [Ketobacter sp.]|uniref:MerR family transcriptional regulator n=1 Tax=Ketobacter sp. TaxID=2083498 RepID=UPI0025BD0579|nr:MerR family transcriptional regulator [Ketobacter sp.]